MLMMLEMCQFAIQLDFVEHRKVYFHDKWSETKRKMWEIMRFGVTILHIFFVCLNSQMGVKDEESKRR
jgi:hypothetical protein